MKKMNVLVFTFSCFILSAHGNESINTSFEGGKVQINVSGEDARKLFDSLDVKVTEPAGSPVFMYQGAKHLIKKGKNIRCDMSLIPQKDGTAVDNYACASIMTNSGKLKQVEPELGLLTLLR